MVILFQFIYIYFYIFVLCTQTHVRTIRVNKYTYVRVCVYVTCGIVADKTALGHLTRSLAAGVRRHRPTLVNGR